MPSINTELGERALSKMQHEMDWKPLKERCLRVYPTWSSRHADRVLREYQRFLALKVATRDIYDTIVLAPQLLDAIWRQHILSTQQYYADCQMLLQANQILHYNADASLNVRQSVREKRMELTKASLCMMFSGMYPLPSDANGIWDYDEKQDSTMNSGVSSVADEDHEDTTDDFATGTEGEETESDLPPKARSPRKERERQRKSKTIPIIKAQTMEHTAESKEERRRLIYIYRAGKVSKLNTHTQETIKNIKAKIHRKIGLTPQQQLLEWDGLVLDENRTIGQYGIPTDSTLVLSKVRAVDQPKSKLKQKQKQQPINTEALKGDETQTEDVDELEDSISHDDEARDQPDEWHKRRSGSPSRRNGSPSRRRSRTKSPPLPRSPRPPKPPRKHSTPTHPPYSPTIREDDSYISSSHSEDIHTEKRSEVLSSLNSELQSATNTEIHSAVHHSQIRSVADDPRRRQQALLNKMKIQSRDQQEDHHREVHHLHRQEDSSIEPQSTLPSRPRLKPTHPINVFVNTIMGFTITLTAKANDTVDHLKQLIEAQEDIPFRKQILILDGVPLNDSRLLSDYTSDSSLHVLLRLQAGKASANSVTTSSFAASSMSPLGSSSMVTATRKKNQNRIMMSRAPPGSSTANNTGVGNSTKWR